VSKEATNGNGHVPVLNGQNRNGHVSVLNGQNGNSRRIDGSDE
jgi:hypothetical protein